jgi:hypothetical protein
MLQKIYGRAVLRFETKRLRQKLKKEILIKNKQGAAQSFILSGTL